MIKKFTHRIVSVVTVFFLLLATIFAGVGCQKQLSYDILVGDTTTITSAFELVPSGNNCSDATVTGAFQAGTAVSQTSFVQLTVNATKTGAWTYSTGTVNGFAFAGAGNFTSTGPQSIMLVAKGTPVNAGTTSFPLKTAAGDCLFSVTVTGSTPPGGGTTITGDIYYKATIDGINYAQDVTDNNGYEAGSGSGGVDDASFGGGVNYGNPPVPKGKTELSVSKGILHHYVGATDAYFKAFFAPGNYAYSVANGDGVSVFWTDPNGESWDTESGSGNQTGSTFKIISVVDAYDLLNNYYIKVKMQFTCKLYNTNTGAVKQLTNGELVAYFGKI